MFSDGCRNSFRWGRGVLYRTLLFLTFVLLFTCFNLLDMKVRCYSECQPVDRDLTSRRDAATHSIFTFDEKLLPNMPRTSSHSAVQASRKLSSHVDGNYLHSLHLEHLEYASEGSDIKLSAVRNSLIGRASTEAVPGIPRRNSTVARRLPQALIIGVKKGGTRALLEILRLHPDVRAPGPEPHFFDRHYYKGLSWYRKQMPLSIEGQLTMEKTPSYLVTPEVPGRVQNMSRDIRLLVVVRDPVTRAVSDYTQAFSKRHDTRTFEDMAFLNSSTGLVDTNWSAIKIGVYAKHLDRWLRYFPLDRFHFVSGEKLISDPVDELRSVQDFLGLRRVISANHFFFNQTKGFPCLRRSPNSTVPHCLGKTKGRSHPYIPPSALQRLRDFYRPFNQKFYKMVGRNFGWL